METPKDYHRRQDCRCCGGTRLLRFLSLGPTPLANRFLSAPMLREPEPNYPLDVQLFRDCSLVQQCDVVSPQVLFRDYIYVTGTSTTMQRHFAELAGTVASRFLSRPGALPGPLVVEAGSNDGTLLGNFSGRDVRVLGVEPAQNLATLAQSRGVHTECDFFGEAAARRIRAQHGPAAAILGNNVFAHVDDLSDFMRGVTHLLEPHGAFIFEVPYLFSLIDELQFDTIYHEHLCYFSLTALRALLRRSEMEIFDVEQLPVHGGSVRVFARQAGGPGEDTGQQAVMAMLAEEQRRGVNEPRPYEEFAKRVAVLRAELLSLLHALKAEGKRVAGYGSPAKGNTLLNYAGIGKDLLCYLVDKNERKQGLFSPGMHLPVHSPERLLLDRPDFALILAWNMADEIMAEQAEFRSRGGRFILPLPRPRILTRGAT